MKKLIFLLLPILVFVSSCNKEKKTLKRIAGQWNVSSYVFHNSSGGTTDILGQNNIVFDFQSCDPGASCNVSTTYSGSFSLVETSTYMVSENSGASTGFSITIDTLEFAINTLTKSEMTIMYPVGSSQSGGASVQGAGTEMTIITLDKL